jgi:hypothetical protein
MIRERNARPIRSSGLVRGDLEHGRDDQRVGKGVGIAHSQQRCIEGLVGIARMAVHGDERAGRCRLASRCTPRRVSGAHRRVVVQLAPGTGRLKSAVAPGAGRRRATGRLRGRMRRPQRPTHRRQALPSVHGATPLQSRWCGGSWIVPPGGSSFFLCHSQILRTNIRGPWRDHPTYHFDGAARAHHRSLSVRRAGSGAAACWQRRACRPATAEAAQALAHRIAQQLRNRKNAGGRAGLVQNCCRSTRCRRRKAWR